MKNISKILVFLFVLVYCGFSEEMIVDKPSRIIPVIEISANTGIVWIAQFKASLNILDKYYIKLRGSESFLTSEKGIILGIQKLSSKKSRFQFGLGYSNGQVEPFVPGGPNADDTTEHWNALIIDSDYIHLFNLDVIKFGFDVGFNFIIDMRRAIPSVNAGILIGIF